MSNRAYRPEVAVASLYYVKESIVQPHTSYLIMATPRSGSYLLCEGLIRTRLAGNPTEYFGPMQTQAIMQHLGTSNYKECLDWIIAQGTTPNGVFGGKDIWGYHQRFVGDLRGALRGVHVA